MIDFIKAGPAYPPEWDDRSQDYAECEVCTNYFELADLTTMLVLDEEINEKTAWVMCPDCADTVYDHNKKRMGR